jgi:hypothetical protein
MNNIFLIILQTALFSINASANTIKTKIENTKTVYTSGFLLSSNEPILLNIVS